MKQRTIIQKKLFSERTTLNAIYRRIHTYNYMTFPKLEMKR